MGEKTQYETIQLLNQQPRGGKVLHYTTSLTLPIWLINEKFPTEPFYHPLETYDYILTDNEDLSQKAQIYGFTVLSMAKDPRSNIPLYLLGINK